MVVGVGDDDVLLQSQAETVRRVELTLAGAELPELAADLHWADLVAARDGARRRIGACSRENSVERIGNYVVGSGE